MWKGSEIQIDKIELICKVCAYPCVKIIDTRYEAQGIKPSGNVSFICEECGNTEIIVEA